MTNSFVLPKKDYILECGLDVCDGGIDCKTRTKPTKTICKQCMCSKCSRNKCQGGS